MQPKAKCRIHEDGNMELKLFNVHANTVTYETE